MKLDHERTTLLEPNCKGKLYVESFNGFYGSGVISQYLTDSSKFRKYTGTYEQPDEFISYKCIGDSIYVYKHKKIMLVDLIFKGNDLVPVNKKGDKAKHLKWDTVIVTKKDIYSIKKLKEE